MEKANLAKQYITEALLLLLEKKSLESIKITEITNKAGVSRMTYYRYFSSKEDILVQLFADLFDSYTEKLNKSDYSVKSFFSFFFNIIYKHRPKISVALPFTTGQKLFTIKQREYLMSICSKVFKRDFQGKDKYFFSGITGALFLISTRWVENGCKESIDEMTDIMLSLINCQ